MKVELIKETDPQGRVWYLVSEKTICHKATQNKKEAEDFFDSMKNYPIREILKTKEI